LGVSISRWRSISEALDRGSEFRDESKYAALETELGEKAFDGITQRSA
jgi:hypothetical protein